MSEAGLKVNATKSHFCQVKLEYLGYIINRKGMMPSTKKVNAILQMDTPKTRKQLRRFIGMVNYYRDMWKKRSEILAPLTALTSSTVKWKWTAVHDKAFEQMKSQIAKDTLLAFPDFNKPFVIHTDASKIQLGACISQEGKPIAFYSRKLNPAQTRYTTTERELLSIVETLKEFRNILLGQQITIHTDHQNLTYKQFTSDRVLRWRLYIEEYSPKILYIKGEKNVVADALSRLELKDIPQGSPTLESFYAIFEAWNTDKADLYTKHPLTYKQLQIAQLKDKAIKKILHMDNTLYQMQDFHGGGKTISLVCFKGKIVVPSRLQKHVISWYHTLLCHPGINRTEESISQHLWWPKMRSHITNYVKACPTCQRNKRSMDYYLPKQQKQHIGMYCV